MTSPDAAGSDLNYLIQLVLFIVMVVIFGVIVVECVGCAESVGL